MLCIIVFQIVTRTLAHFAAMFILVTVALLHCIRVDWAVEMNSCVVSESKNTNLLSDEKKQDIAYHVGNINNIMFDSCTKTKCISKHQKKIPPPEKHYKF